RGGVHGLGCGRLAAGRALAVPAVRRMRPRARSPQGDARARRAAGGAARALRPRSVPSAAQRRTAGSTRLPALRRVRNLRISGAGSLERERCALGWRVPLLACDPYAAEHVRTYVEEERWNRSVRWLKVAAGRGSAPAQTAVVNTEKPALAAASKLLLPGLEMATGQATRVYCLTAAALVLSLIVGSWFVLDRARPAAGRTAQAPRAAGSGQPEDRRRAIGLPMIDDARDERATAAPSRAEVSRTFRVKALSPSRLPVAYLPLALYVNGSTSEPILTDVDGLAIFRAPAVGAVDIACLDREAYVVEKDSLVENEI